MTRGEAINWIINLAADIGKCEHQDLWHYEQALEEIRDMIEALPSAQPQQRWIPVTERLPEVRRWVLCQCRANIMDVLRLTDDGSWYRQPHTIYMGGFVLAWMPLPEPYQEVENEQS